MASVHRINEALAAIRGAPLATIESYTRVLRTEGVLPRTKRGSGATRITSTHAALILLAVMRGSPTAAAKNARDVGGLILFDGGATYEQLHDRIRAALGWADDTTLAQAIAWLIDRFGDGTISEYVQEGEAGHGVTVRVDRYWTRSWLHWVPAKKVSDQWIQGFRESVPSDSPFRDAVALGLTTGVGDIPPWPSNERRDLEHELQLRGMELIFFSPLLYELKASYHAGDHERNRKATRQYSESAEQVKRSDLIGSESVTQRTLIALSEAFKD